jgi:hypothetical protein
LWNVKRERDLKRSQVAYEFNAARIPAQHLHSQTRANDGM